MSEQTSIGSLNSTNVFWFKISIRIIPAMFLMVVSWAIWITPQVILNSESRSQGGRFTASDAAAMASDIKIWHREDVEKRTDTAEQAWVGVSSHVNRRLSLLEVEVRNLKINQ